MIVNVEDAKRCYIVCGKTDMRYGIDSLAYTVQPQFDLDPIPGCFFSFVGTKKTALMHYIGMGVVTV
ncbi:IS66 family insertion sequence element accessory protein TnpB [Gracilibacillus salinarum]|uniref:IS66 family insertion sequence element accessory protein TnpB n=1 Tax=Gracilibacillus salinarum TaxID=2932255 RepID=A0ABY4GRM6_9BACI|nr:IS66 family insertion sequence element accessory protein TnpB [Gracilibacillus salinarum]UOQ87027.1 IS66 family insertion sequence element accessory protein TnpB [Gracilibacillus salinarum]